MEFSLSLDFNPDKTMKTDFLIIGGGAAGLSAANALAEKGAEVALLEEGSYPAHKICGEFLSPELLPVLENWGIESAASVKALKAVLPSRECSFELPVKAGSLSRYILEESLVKRAAKYGAQIKPKTHVEKIDIPKSEGQPYVVTLASGEEWVAPIVLISTGRLVGKITGQKPPKFCYIGAKTHFEGIDCRDELVMHLMPGAYFGMVSIGPSRVNVAGLIACKLDEGKHPKDALAAFLERDDILTFRKSIGRGQMAFDDWMVAPVPERRSEHDRRRPQPERRLRQPKVRRVLRRPSPVARARGSARRLSEFP